MVNGDGSRATTVRCLGVRASGRARPDHAGQGRPLFLVGALAGTVAGTVASAALRRRFAGAPRPPIAPALDETTAQLDLVTEQLLTSRADLAAARAEVERMSGQVAAQADRAETEMGRMESAAIAALEAAASSNRQEVAGLRDQLAAAEEAARALRAELDAERGRSEQLQTALTGRDDQLANLRATIRGAAGRRD